MKGFYTELSRLKTMIAEVVWPTDSCKMEGTDFVEFEDSDEETFQLCYSPARNSFVAKYETGIDTVFPITDCAHQKIDICISIWANKTGPNDMESIGALLTATYNEGSVKKSTGCTDLQRTESVVPDVKFLEDMTLQDVEQVAHYLLKCIRSMIKTLNERNSPCQK